MKYERSNSRSRYNNSENRKMSKDSKKSNDESDGTYLAKFKSSPSDLQNNDRHSIDFKDKHNANINNENSPSWKSHHRTPPQKKFLSFHVFIFDKAAKFLKENNENALKDLIYKNDDSRIYFDDSLEIPDVPGNVLVIENDSLDKKTYITKQIFQLFKENNVDEKKEKGQNALILVPNGLVSMVIGTKGKQIINLAKSTRTLIAVNQPIYKMKHRTISITGYPQQISEAIRQIYKIMEDRYYEVKHAEVDSIPLDIFKTTTTVSYYFIFRLVFF